MKVKILLILVLSVTTLTAFAQDGGVRGRVVSRAGRVALDGVKVTMTPGDVTVMSDERGNFLIENVPAGEYSLQFETPEFEPLSIAVRVGSQVRDINAVVLVPDVPRQMIEAAVAEGLQGASGGMEVIISVPGGEEVGKRTFNPHLGIVGGISILGTSGIVEPMSEQALVDTTRVELNMCRAGGATDLLLTVGNYGDDFASCKLGLSLAGRIKCSNFIGQTLSDAISLGFRRVLLIGHIGKLVKLGAGIMNTHSAQGDARMEILVSCALARGASLEALRAVAACITTEAALEELRRFGLLEETMKELGERIGQQLDRRFGRFLELGVLVFSGQKEAGEILCRCGRVEAFLEEWRKTP